jgi:hypothetical protein
MSLLKQLDEMMNIDPTQQTKQTKQNKYKFESNVIFNKVSRNNGIKYKKLQSQVKILGAITATLAVINSNILPFEKPSSTNALAQAVTFGLLTFAIAAYHLFLNSKAERIKQSLKELKEFLNDKANCCEIFNNFLLYRHDKFAKITCDEFERLIYHWVNGKPTKKRSSVFDNAFVEILNFIELRNISLKNLAKKIGYNDFSILLISKGLEKNILFEEENSLDGITTIHYLIKSKGNA